MQIIADSHTVTVRPSRQKGKPFPLSDILREAAAVAAPSKASRRPSRGKSMTNTINMDALATPYNAINSE